MTKVLIVDVQEDFCEGGALAVDGGWRVASRISNFLEGHVSQGLPAVITEVIATRDFHEPHSSNGGHISEDPDFVDTWPAHCVQGSAGADYAWTNKAGLPITHVIKGMGVPAYSALEGIVEATGKPLEVSMDEEYVVFGLATDYCVRATVMDLLKAGAHVTVYRDMCAPVTFAGGEAALDEMQASGARIR